MPSPTFAFAPRLSCIAGPFAGIWYVYNNRGVSTSAETPKWILALGGVGIVIGLATYGEVPSSGCAAAAPESARGCTQ